MNSKQKGDRGERELSNKLKEYGYGTRRGQQYCGANGDADVVGLPGIHIECKRVEKLNIDEALEQATADSEPTINDIHKPLKLPAVFHRRNKKMWKVTMYLEDWIKLYDRYNLHSPFPDDK
jgi:hypothetical protein